MMQGEALTAGGLSVEAELALLGLRACAGGCGSLVDRDWCEECVRLNLEYEARRRRIAAQDAYAEARREGRLLDFETGLAEMPAELLPSSPGDDLFDAIDAVRKWFVRGCVGLVCALLAGALLYGFCELVQVCVALLVWGSR